MQRVILNSVDFPSQIRLSNSDGSVSDTRFTPQAVITDGRVARGFADIDDAATYLRRCGDTSVRYISGCYHYIIPSSWVGDGESIVDRLVSLTPSGNADELTSETLTRVAE